MDDNGYDPLWDDLPSTAASIMFWFEVAVTVFIVLGIVVTLSLLALGVF